MTEAEILIHQRNPELHLAQKQLVYSSFKRIIVKAGRRGGKTVGAAIKAVESFLAGRRVLYAAPTSEQTDTFWFEVKQSLYDAVDSGVFRLNESERFIERPNTQNRIKAKTAWNANTLRGDYADLLILDEFQLTNEDAWNEVGAPMLLDNNGDAVFIFTPPSLMSAGISKARDPRHASKMFKRALSDATGLWEAIHFTSHDNPFISSQALNQITADMSFDSYRREIMAEDDEIEQSWLVYGKWNERVCKIHRFPIPNNWLIYVGHDFGIANPAAIFLAQNPAEGTFFAFHEYCPGSGLSTNEHVLSFQSTVQGYNVLKRVGGNVTTEDEIRQGYTAHGWPITAPKIVKPNAQIDRVLGLVELNKLYVFDDLYNLLSQMANCMWKLDDENKPVKGEIKDEAKYHLLAALRYIGSDFTPETASNQGARMTRLRDRRN